MHSLLLTKRSFPIFVKELSNVGELIGYLEC